MLLTAMVVPQNVCGRFWSFLTVGERQCFIAVSKECDEFALRHARGGRHTTGSCSSLSSSISRHLREATASIEEAETRCNDRGASPPSYGLPMGSRWDGEIRAPLYFFRDGTCEASSDCRGRDSIGFLANSGGATCGYPYDGWLVDRVDIHLRSAGRRAHFESGIEETAVANIRLVFRLCLAGGFARRQARRRRGH